MHLAESIREWPDQEELSHIIAGVQDGVDVQWRTLTGWNRGSAPCRAYCSFQVNSDPAACRMQTGDA